MGSEICRRSELDYAYVEDIDVGGIRQVFVRLVPAGQAFPAATHAADAEVDVDSAGQVIGVTLSWRKS